MQRTPSSTRLTTIVGSAMFLGFLITLVSSLVFFGDEELHWLFFITYIGGFSLLFIFVIITLVIGTILYEHNAKHKISLNKKQEKRVFTLVILATVTLLFSPAIGEALESGYESFVIKTGIPSLCSNDWYETYHCIEKMAIFHNDPSICEQYKIYPSDRTMIYASKQKGLTPQQFIEEYKQDEITALKEHCVQKVTQKQVTI